MNGNRLRDREVFEEQREELDERVVDIYLGAPAHAA